MAVQFTYRPRALALLKLPVFGSTEDKDEQADNDQLYDLELRVRHVEWTRNDHNHADEVKVTVEWYDAGIDPRYISSAVLSLYIGQADEFGNWQPSDETDLRFVGIVTRPERSSAADGTLTVEIQALDLTNLFIRTKPIRSVGIPDLTLTLSQAWQLICDNVGFYDHQAGTFVSTVQSLKNKLEFVGQAADVEIGKSVPSRLAGLGKVHPDTGEPDAWAIWQQCVGSVGYISFIDRDRCVVTTALDFYSSQNPVRLIYGGAGRGIREHSEVRNCAANAIGIGLTSFDPTTGKTIEAYYPPLAGQVLHKGAQTKKEKHALPEGSIKASQYQMFPYPGVSDQSALDFAARRVFEEYSRQDMQGTVVTHEMVLPRVDGSMVDALSIGAGDAIRVEFDENLKSELIKRDSEDARINYLLARGYSSATAALMAANVADISKLQPECSVVKVETSFEASPDGGSFEIHISYNARLQIDGTSDDTTSSDGTLTVQPIEIASTPTLNVPTVTIASTPTLQVEQITIASSK